MIVHHAELSRQNLYKHLIVSLYPHVRKEISKQEQNVSVESTCTSLNSTLQDLYLPPLILHSVAHSVLSVGKRKVSQVEKAMSVKVAKAVKFNPDQLASPDYIPEFSTDIEKKANNLDYLVSQVKMKIQTANCRQKIQILTLSPKSWTLRQAAKEFNVSKAK